MSLIERLLFYLALVIGIYIFLKLSPAIPLAKRLLIAATVVIIAFLIFLFVSAVLALILVIIAILILLSLFKNKNIFRFKR